MQEGDAIFIRVCYPLDFEDKVKSKGKYDLKELYEKGIMLSVNEITKNNEPSDDILQAIRLDLGCHPMTPYKTMIFDLDEFKNKFDLWTEFVKDNGKFGNNCGERFIWLLRHCYAASLLFSNRLNKRLDSEETQEMPRWNINRHVREFEVGNEKIYLHSMFITYQKHLIEEPIFTDIEKGDFKILWDMLNGKSKKVQKSVRDPISNSLRHEVFKRDNYTCKECGRTNKESIIHCDHIIPVTQGGTDELSNLQTLCEECNLQKKNRAWESKGVKA